MSRPQSFAVVLTLTSILGALPSQVARPKKRDPSIEASLKKHASLILDEKRDGEAIELIDGLLKKYDGMHAVDQRRFAEGIAYVLTSSRCRRKPGKAEIYRVTIRALGTTGKNGGAHLKKAFEKKSKFKGKEWIELRVQMLEHLGRTKDPKYTKMLVKVARFSPSDLLAASAGGALRHHRALKLSARKVIAKKLIGEFATIYGRANENLNSGDPMVRTAKDRLERVKDPWNKTLKALTRQNLTAPLEWQRFKNKHRDHNWDKPLPKKTR